MALDRNAILQVQDLQTEEVEVPEWGGTVYVRGMSENELQKLEAVIAEAKGNYAHPKLRNFRARVIVMTVCDEKGALLFTEEDVPVLAEKSSSAIVKVFDVARRLSKLGEDDVDEATKNSSSDLGEGLHSD